MIKLEIIILSLAIILKFGHIMPMHGVARPSPYAQKSNSISIRTHNLHFKTKENLKTASEIAHTPEHMQMLREKLDQLNLVFDDQEYKIFREKLLKAITKLESILELSKQENNFVYKTQVKFEEFIKDI